MVLITGGAYQGKLDYARREYGITEADVFDCRAENRDALLPSLDFNKKVLTHVEGFVLACVKAGIDAQAYLEKNRDALAGKILIADDVTQGVVPIDAEERAWREETGRCLTMLGLSADRVVRVFCGIPQEIKGE
jgi:adenosyl cobinamide kinase/adenosyl cobinamide phosphate guanylyltransferase